MIFSSQGCQLISQIAFSPVCFFQAAEHVVLLQALPLPHLRSDAIIERPDAPALLMQAVQLASHQGFLLIYLYLSVLSEQQEQPV